MGPPLVLESLFTSWFIAILYLYFPLIIRYTSIISPLCLRYVNVGSSKHFSLSLYDTFFNDVTNVVARFEPFPSHQLVFVYMDTIPIGHTPNVTLPYFYKCVLQLLELGI